MRYVFGEWKASDVALTRQEVQDLTRLARERAAEMAAYPTDRIYAFLDRLAALWSDENYEGRKKALAYLPEETGFSKEMVELGLKELPRLFDSEALARKSDTELRGAPALGEQRYDLRTNTGLAWRPIGTVLHVLAGNVFLGAPGSWLEGLLTKNVNILKMSSGERVFLPLLVRSIEECDEDGVISRSLAVIDYPSSRTDLIEELKASVDGIVVWGGEQAVKAYQANLSIHTRLIAFGPKLSLALVTNAALKETSIDDLSKRIAFDVSIWDQNACTAPQLVFVEGAENAAKLAEKLGHELSLLAKNLPAGPADLQTAVEIRKLRTVFEIAAGRGEGALHGSESDLAYTVVVDQDKTIDPSPLHRTIRVVPIETVSSALKEVRKIGGYIQTIGLAAGLSEQEELSLALAQAGAVRIVDVGSMAGGEIDDPHDGQYDLEKFVHFVFQRLKRPNSIGTPLDVASPEQFKSVVNGRLRTLVRKARRAPLYAERFQNLKIETVEDLRQVPPLTRNDIETQMPPAGRGLEAVDSLTGGYISRSGGSTGEPKFSIYDGHDWEQMIAHATSLFHTMGLRRGDRVANCFMAGDLYGSFVSFDHINARMGVTTLGFAGQVTPEFLVHTFQRVGFNVIMGVPPFLMPLLREAKRLEPGLRLEKVLYAGSPLSPADREWLSQDLGVKRIASVIGANDGGQMAYQCERMSGRFHHVVDDFNYMEIVDDEGQPVAEGEAGRILITSLLKFAYPLIRYEIGDKARFVPGRCACGSHRRVIEYLGRADDLIAVGLMNFSYSDCVEALKGLPVSELQIRISSADGKETILLNIETEHPSARVEEQVRETVLGRLQKLPQRITEGAVLLEVKSVRPGSLARNARTGKLKQVVDERI